MNIGRVNDLQLQLEQQDPQPMTMSSFFKSEIEGISQIRAGISDMYMAMGAHLSARDEDLE